MKRFVLHLLGAPEYLKIPDVTSFVGQDDSGSFGLFPDHARMMSVLSYGLARFMKQDGSWTYLAVPGGLIYFVENELHIVTRRYFLEKDYEKISTSLLDALLAEEEELRSVKENILRLEQEMLRRLWQIERGR